MAESKKQQVMNSLRLDFDKMGNRVEVLIATLRMLIATVRMLIAMIRMVVATIRMVVASIHMLAMPMHIEMLLVALLIVRYTVVTELCMD